MREPCVQTAGAKQLNKRAVFSPLCIILQWQTKNIALQITAMYCWLGHRRHNWQATASFECCSTSSQWYEEVWSWTVSAYACRPSLAPCSWASKVQTRDDGV